MNMSGIALRCEPGCHGFGHFDCSARWRSLRFDCSARWRSLRFDCSARWRPLCLMARSARCDVRRGAAVFVRSDETPVPENHPSF
jgi:hypothetical protein